MNKSTFIGRLGQDVKFYPPQGQKKAFCTFSLGIKRPGGWKDAQGKEITDWLDFTASGKTAELIQQYAGTKGSLLAIADAIAMKETFQDQSGQNRQSVKFFVKDLDLSVTFATNSSNGNNQGNQNSQGGGRSNNTAYNNSVSNNSNDFSRGRAATAPATAPYSPDVNNDGDLPF